MNYDIRADDASVKTAMSALSERGILVELVKTGPEAFEKIKSYIPSGASVMNGSSATLEQIGFVDYLKAGEHGWNNLHEAILNEKDSSKQDELRKQSILSEYYLGSAHAIAQTGEMVIASASGSQLPHLVYTSPNIILVAGTHKIVPTLHDALDRLRSYVFPLEDARMKSAGAGGSTMAKVLLFEQEPKWTNRSVRLVLVDEVLGF